MGRLNIGSLWQGLTGDKDGAGDRIVPPTGFTAQLTLFSAGAMAFLAVFALALALATGRLADRWSSELAGSVTVRVSAPVAEQDALVQSALSILQTTPGAGTPRLLPEDELAQLLEPWFGPDMPVDALPVPALIDLPVEGEFDAEGLRLRLEAEVPGAVLDDHTEWRRPLVSAANRLRMLGIVSLMLIGAASAAMITLAAKAALAANVQVIRVLRLIGARDLTIATAFVRRFTRRAAMGSAVGTVLGMGAIAILPDASAAGGFLTGLGFQGADWLMPLTIPLIAAGVGFVATRWAALKMLEAVR
ncbi:MULTISPECIES: cell division protein FtsX [Paracoccus]|jgi:cell division transport system permease protein|uniref:Cell division protein FtsX n=2 Tax=Paracoccus TaxID=265 RepID=A0A5C4R1U9_9RHOB|nr:MULTISPECIES: cell division protein FtsX [Paracoccus]TYP66557.1 cell division transport system permease protein [Stutzerimonas stutzeri]AZY92971.1 cell division protein FtsX [Paracoccus sp. Arc7-R13]KJZ31368.1 cell division protein FtsX [Paracoccus sp. S4493]MCO6362704.1 cell division protein FtsX [Paracoccus sp. 08]TNB90445.1 cell division protein FtsX [Paracoccus marcusii]|tara:strand:- start:2404 stop:3315 length:912 start_codon:yes stop_codon:yes gene_type:complete